MFSSLSSENDSVIQRLKLHLVNLNVHGGQSKKSGSAIFIDYEVSFTPIADYRWFARSYMTNVTISNELQTVVYMVHHCQIFTEVKVLGYLL